MEKRVVAQCAGYMPVAMFYQSNLEWQPEPMQALQIVLVAGNGVATLTGLHDDFINNIG